MSETGEKPNLTYRYRFGDAMFDESEMSLVVGGMTVELERRPLELLSVLLAHVDEAMTKEELLNTVWSGHLTVENVLPNAIAKLRKALGPDLAERISTLQRIGYRFNGPVERTAAGRKHASELDLKPGQAAPLRTHYKLEKQLSGRRDREVWRARHEKTGETRVFKYSSSSEALVGLKREATLYRLLSHALGDKAPIVQVYDWNFETEPFFLESADGGRDLNTWAENGTLSSLPKADRLQLCIAIAGAVAAAHNAGVLHKDIKPSNILIDPAAETPARGVRLVDFGSGDLVMAERLAEASITPLGWTHSDQNTPLNSTPMYTAPEVFSSGLYSIKSDVFALGMIVYQIMAGDTRKPMASGWEQDIDDDILCADIAEATLGDPGKRLASAELLSRRLESLEGRRAQAEAARLQAEREAALQESIDRARARRPWLVAAGLSLLAGIAASSWFGIDANAARKEAEHRARQAEIAREFTSEILVYTAPAMTDDVSREALETVIGKAEEQLRSQAVDDDETTAAISLVVGRVRDSMSDMSEALQAYQNAAAAFEKVEGKSGARTIEANYRAAWILASLLRLDEAEALMRATDQAALRHKGELSFEIQYLALDCRATLASRRGQPEAIGLFRQMVSLLEESSDPVRRDLGYRTDFDKWMRARFNLAQHAALFGQQDAAQAAMAPVLEKIEAGGDAITDPIRMLAFNVQAFVSLMAGANEESIDYNQRARALSETIYGPDAEYTLSLDQQLASAQINTGDLEGALATSGAGKELACRNGINGSTYCIYLKDSHALALFHLGRRQAAAEEFEELIGDYASIQGERSLGVMRMHYFLAHCLLDLSRFAEARRSIDAMDADYMDAQDQMSDWHVFRRAIEARYAFLTEADDDSRAQLEAMIGEMREKGADDFILSLFLEDLN